MGDVSVNELAETLGLTKEGVYRQVRDGLPHRRDGRWLKIDRQAAAEWYAVRGMTKHALRLCEAKRAEDVVVQPKAFRVESAVVSTDPLDELLAAARKAERDALALYENHATNPVMAGALLDSHGNAMERRRRVEKDISEIRLSQRNVMPRSEAERELRDMAVEIRTNLLALPAAVAGRCEMRKAGEVHLILVDAINAALRRLATAEGTK
jgi:hypothetical protein